MIRRIWSAVLSSLIVASFSATCFAQTSKVIGDALRFHASFDNSGEANFGQGDKRIWHSVSMDKRDEAKPGLPPTTNVRLDSSIGKFGGSVRFMPEQGPIVFYQVDGNFPAPTKNWEGTVSFWLSADPSGELREGFCDPIQITSKQWDDASFFVEFEKRATGIPFRLGVYADKHVWNPSGRKFESIPPEERPLTTVLNPPFGKAQWTHVAFTFQGFNTEGSNGKAVLYLNGEKQGELVGRPQVFTWDIKKAAVMLGLNYVGAMDDLALFQRSLNEQEIKVLYALPDGITTLYHK